jgi:2-methylcitrate dehydratase PrpD
MTAVVGSATRTVAEYASSLCFSDLSDGQVMAAKNSIMDTIGCAIGGTALDAGQIVVDMASEQGGAAQATILGQNFRIPAALAASTNAYLANLLDFDDTLSGACHPGAPVVAAALAAGEHRGVSGAWLLTSVIVGYEVTHQLGAALEPSAERRSRVKGLATYQTLGAAAAVARLHDFDVAQTTETLGTAAAWAPVPFVRKWGYRERPISWVKNNYGAAAHAAVVAADLVGRGFHASRTILDGETGFWIMAGSDQWADDRLMKHHPNGDAAITRTAYKPYPCCRFLHPSIDAALDLRAQHHFDPLDVESVTVQVFSDYVLQNFMWDPPANPIDAQFSLPHAISVALCGNPQDPAWFRAPLLLDPVVRRVAAKVRAECSEQSIGADIGRSLWSVVSVQLTGGQSLQSRVDVPRGEPERPLSFSELSDKFVLLTEPRIGTRQAMHAVDVISSLDACESLQPLITLIEGEQPMT